jgi:hypothetical protein
MRPWVQTPELPKTKTKNHQKNKAIKPKTTTKRKCLNISDWLLPYPTPGQETTISHWDSWAASLLVTCGWFYTEARYFWGLPSSATGNLMAFPCHRLCRTWSLSLRPIFPLPLPFFFPFLTSPPLPLQPHWLPLCSSNQLRCYVSQDHPFTWMFSP